MKVNFGNVEDAKDISSLIDEGDYICVCVKVEEGNTDDGDAMWNLWWKIYDGAFENRYIFDRLFFNQKCYPRMKLILGRLGFDVSGELDLTTDMLVGKFALVTVKHKVQTKGKNAGKNREEVPFGGYQAVEVSEEGESATEAEDQPDF
jgi:hypothetical protein